MVMEALSLAFDVSQVVVVAGVLFLIYRYTVAKNNSVRSMQDFSGMFFDAANEMARLHEKFEDRDIQLVYSMVKLMDARFVPTHSLFIFLTLWRRGGNSLSEGPPRFSHLDAEASEVIEKALGSWILYEVHRNVLVRALFLRHFRGKRKKLSRRQEATIVQKIARTFMPDPSDDDGRLAC
jgi:hypothetical protein